MRIKLLEVEKYNTQKSDESKALDAAKLNLISLNKCLETKEDTISELRGLLLEANRTANLKSEEYQDAVSKLNREISHRKSLDFSKNCEVSRDIAPFNQINLDLEETISHQKRMIGSLTDQLNDAHKQLEVLRTQYKQRIEDSESHVTDLKEKRTQDMKKVKNILQKVKIDVKKKNELIASLTDGQTRNVSQEEILKKEIADLKSQICKTNDDNSEKLKSTSKLLFDVKKQNKAQEIIIQENCNEKERHVDANSINIILMTSFGRGSQNMTEDDYREENRILKSKVSNISKY
ncbi:uncharacterized protein LOC115228351 [Octopus sinensis]|uniref:Uncharacterized protein LOC115228351 n=1 Tax=Octopus sinensis TaxID=2607531 RepID=A0A6P7U1G5_9MOLL|nr:uncharacterized protein LOC115228351 [Octopus sinensis]